MPVLSAAQAYKYARQAGFNASEAVTAVAIMYPESGGHFGDSSSINGSSPARGPMQVEGTPVHNYDLTRLNNDPLYNFQAAFHVYKTEGWKAWTTYSSGAYKKYLPQAMAGAAGQGNIQPVADVSGTGAGLSSVGDALKGIYDFFAWFTKASNWERIGYFILGGILMWIGLKQLSKSSQTAANITSKVTDTASKVKSAIGPATEVAEAA